MSLDTVLQIGKALRNSDNNLKYFKYVEQCPKDNKGNWPICITIPVKSDFSFDWENVELTPENKRDKLYYLKFKPSDADSSASKYLFGDIYYLRKTTIDKTGKTTKINDFGNFTLEKGNAFINGLKPYNEILTTCQTQYLAPLFEDISDKKLRQDILKAIIKKYSDKENFKLSKKLELNYTKIKKGCELLGEYFAKDELIRFHSAFEQNIEKFNLLLQYAPAFHSILEDTQKKIVNYFSNKDELEKEYITAVYRSIDDKTKKSLSGQQTIDSLTKEIDSLTDDEKKKHKEIKQKVLQYANFNVFIHFEFAVGGNKLSWHEMEEPFRQLKDKLNSEITRQTEKGLVPNAYIYRTLCSGNNKNDIQFPNFEIDNSYKSFVFENKEEFDNLLYTGNILNKSFHRLYKTNIDLFIFPVAIQGKMITAQQYDTFIEKTNEDLLQSKNDLLLFMSHNDVPKSFNKFDFVLSDSSGNTTNDLVEISGIKQSELKSISKQIRNIAKYYNETKGHFHPEDFTIEKSFLNVLGTYRMTKSGFLEVNENHRYKSHLLKNLPLIYMKNYFHDAMLISVFIENIESIVRIVKEKYTNYKYASLEYDLKFLYSIQNHKTNKYMEIADSKNYKIGVGLGKLAKPLKKKINSFEKKYVGLLTRRVSTKDDCIEFCNEINEMLVRHEKTWGQLASETIENLVLLPQSEYDKEKLALGFFEGYFKYEANDDKRRFLSQIEKIISDYEGKDGFEEEIQLLTTTLDEINNLK